MITQSSRPADGGPEADLDAIATTYATNVASATAREQCRMRDEFTTYCLPFARRLAGRYRGRGETLEDLEQVARLGLVKAIARYDPARGSFTSYALTTVIGELKRHFRDTTWTVHVSRRLQDLGLEVRRAGGALSASLARTPTTEEIAEHLRVPVADVRDAIRSSACYWVASLNAPAATDQKAELGDLIGRADPMLETVDDRITVAGLVRLLPEREQVMIAMRFSGNCSQSEIAAVLGVSQMQVSRLLSAALAWLREAMLNDHLPPRRVSTGRAIAHIPLAAAA
ncbi:sigma-70 family RNA polymerase sigma factor [Paractinoplanes rishiriensis]|uniref:sigma-70 family RNA polymerase sigma factor n=1 Tax=Paractinoplanes rishiriensis TaxID=1050105 RepID=UPI001EF246B8|nr:sigma-70 family RNA polymerase sigma factor [Actinoplanes rishiriensis]